jgi:hypothetical protein
VRITDRNEELIPEKNRTKLPEGARFCMFLEFVLKRDVHRRPTLEQIIAKFDEMFPEAQQEPDSQ